MHNFKELNVWKAGIEFSGKIFKVTRSFPPEDKYTLTSQLLRSAISIPSNIAEGCGRQSQKELSRYLDVSMGSSFEVETQLIIAHSFGYLPDSEKETLCSQIIDIQKMLFGLQKSLTNRNT